VRELVIEFLRARRLGNAQSHRNLTVFSLVGGSPMPGDYLLLDEALALRSVKITERDMHPTVPELRVTNESDKPLLLLDGEELIGAKQNRVLNTSVLVAARSDCLINVTCVEAGRWSYKSQTFTSCGNQYYSRGRQRKMEEVLSSLSSGGPASADQSRVWSDLDTVLEDANVDSITAAMHDAYAALEDRIGDYLREFHPVEDQTGAVFALNGEIVGMDAFDRPDTFAKVLPKLVKSYALDAILEEEKAVQIDRSAAQDFVRSAVDGTYEVFPSAGAGRDVCISSPFVTGLALVVDSHVLHLSMFARPQSERRRYRTRMACPSHRRRTER